MGRNRFCFFSFLNGRKPVFVAIEVVLLYFVVIFTYQADHAVHSVPFITLGVIWLVRGLEEIRYRRDQGRYLSNFAFGVIFILVGLTL